MSNKKSIESLQAEFILESLFGMSADEMTDIICAHNEAKQAMIDKERAENGLESSFKQGISQGASKNKGHHYESPVNSNYGGHDSFKDFSL